MISSRTPNGVPNHCPVCDATICIDPSDPPGDAPCPSCGTLLWFAKTPDGIWIYENRLVAPTRQRLFHLLCDNLGINPDQVSLNLSFNSEYFESLDFVEFIMELEEEFDFKIPDEDAVNIHTVRDLLD
jgi:acyl carrier protein